MFNAKQFTEYQAKIGFTIAIAIIATLLWGIIIALIAILLNMWPDRTVGEMFRLSMLGMPLVVIGAMIGAYLAAGRFISALYGVSVDNALEFIRIQILGRPGFRPMLRVTAGNIVYSDETVKNIGGPGGIIIYNDSAVVLERAGKLTRAIVGPAAIRLEPFEKVWDTIDLLPHRWVFPVGAITNDGLFITCEADIKFKVARTEADVFKAATCKWIRDAHRTEPDRLMTWPKRVIISATEGTLRSILATYSLDQLLENTAREEIRKKLAENLHTAGTNFGVTINDVTLGNITFNERVLDEWYSVWLAERDREVQEALTEAKARRIEMEERARIEVRARMLQQTVNVLKRLKQQDVKNPERLVILSFIQMIRNTDHALFLPDQMLVTLDSLSQRFEAHQSGEDATPTPETPPQQ